MQMVEIAKALSLNARIIVMDEPTASLTAGESEQLFGIIRKLRAEGIGIVYISHRLEEVFALSDRIRCFATGATSATSSAPRRRTIEWSQMMVGRELSNQYFPARVERPEGDVVLDVCDIVVPGDVGAHLVQAARAARSSASPGSSARGAPS